MIDQPIESDESKVQFLAQQIVALVSGESYRTVWLAIQRAKNTIEDELVFRPEKKQ